MSQIEVIVEGTIERIKAQLPERAIRVSNVLHDSVYHVMVNHSVSAPGEPPGVRSGFYRSSFIPSMEGGGIRFISKVTSDCHYGPFLEYGTSKMAPRPHCKRILDDATPTAIAIYSEPY